MHYVTENIQFQIIFVEFIFNFLISILFIFHWKWVQSLRFSQVLCFIKNEESLTLDCWKEIYTKDQFNT